MKWFRMYTEVVDDPKVQRLPAGHFRLWVNCLCLARKNGGALPSIEHIAWLTRTDDSKATEMIQDLIDAGLIDRNENDKLTPHNWNARQYDTDISTERVRTYRAKVRANGQTITGYLKHRRAVFSRDGNKCVYCGSQHNLCLDHMIPVTMGGDDDITNLACACKSCNSGKAGRTPEMAGMVITNPATLEAYAVTVARMQAGTVTGDCVTVACSGSATAKPSVSVSVLSEDSNKTKDVEIVAEDDVLEQWNELKKIYWAAGKPWPERQEQVLFQRFLSLDPQQRRKLLDYVKMRILDGTWRDPQHTKSLMNLLSDGDFEVEHVPRVLPMVRSPSRGQQAHEIAARLFAEE